MEKLWNCVFEFLWETWFTIYITISFSACPLVVTLNEGDRDKSDTEATNEKRESIGTDQSEGAVGGVMETIQTHGAGAEEEYVVKVFGKNDPRPPLEEPREIQESFDGGQVVDTSQIEVELETQQITEPSGAAGQRRHSKSKQKVSCFLLTLSMLGNLYALL